VEGSSQNGWNEYSKLVLKELETLAKTIGSLRTELQEVKQELAKMQVREDRIEEVRVWKEKIDDIASPPQLREYIEKINELETFKTKSVTIFAVVQFLMAGALALFKMT